MSTDLPLKQILQKDYRPFYCAWMITGVTATDGARHSPFCCLLCLPLLLLLYLPLLCCCLLCFLALTARHSSSMKDEQSYHSICVAITHTYLHMLAKGADCSALQTTQHAG